MTSLRDRVAVALHDDECHDGHCNGSSLSAFYRQADVALKAAGSDIGAAEREIIRKLVVRWQHAANDPSPASLTVRLAYLTCADELADLLGGLTATEQPTTGAAT